MALVPWHPPWAGVRRPAVSDAHISKIADRVVTDHYGSLPPGVGTDTVEAIARAVVADHLASLPPPPQVPAALGALSPVQGTKFSDITSSLNALIESHNALLAALR